MEHKGFQNARGVTAFAVGMRIYWCGIWYIVRFVHPNGDGLVTFEPDHVASRIIGVSKIPDCTLDLDSVWVGRHYMGEPVVGDNEAVAKAISEDTVAYAEHTPLLVATRENFLKYYKPLPLPAVPDTGTGEWRPEAGKPCLHAVDGKVVPIGPDPDNKGNIVCAFWRNGQRHFFSYISTLLYSLPPEPPVKVGEYLSVTRRGTEYVGHARNVDPVSHMFQVGGSSEIFDWDDAGTSIVHLIPHREASHE